ncbi:hypothetical protein [Vibrio phage JSF12]|uniref:Uncharacterized protein n=2 Tax=Jesfedecavirus TaxID=2560156 RepID=A0A2D0Z2V6_9CAUD|nr:hypothetical protein FDI98_gp125 [Vibrio phage JSF10]YP_009794705.1 hypothetical protein HOS35_gp022 [Vibrio phage JSF12]ASV43407.1 hypothetical protein [Vibrio phage JSF10]ASV43540.1 hypothetical protein [Vibrio phage JSF12]
MNGKQAKTLRFIAVAIVESQKGNLLPKLEPKTFGSHNAPISTKRVRNSLDKRMSVTTETLAYPEGSVKRVYKDLKSGKISYDYDVTEDGLKFYAIPA